MVASHATRDMRYTVAQRILFGAKLHEVMHLCLLNYLLADVAGVGQRDVKGLLPTQYSSNLTSLIKLDMRFL